MKYSNYLECDQSVMGNYIFQSVQCQEMMMNDEHDCKNCNPAESTVLYKARRSHVGSLPEWESYGIYRNYKLQSSSGLQTTVGWRVALGSMLQ